VQAVAETVLGWIQPVEGLVGQEAEVSRVCTVTTEIDLSILHKPDRFLAIVDQLLLVFHQFLAVVV